MNMNLINACIFAVVLGVSAIAIAADVVVVDEKIFQSVMFSSTATLARPLTRAPI
jgi:hypothetical protein